MQPIMLVPGFITSSLIVDYHLREGRAPWDQYLKDWPCGNQPATTHGHRQPYDQERCHQKNIASTKYFRKRCWRPSGSQLKLNQKLRSSLCSSIYLQAFWVSKTPRRGQWAVNQSKGFGQGPKQQEHRLRALPLPHVVLEASHPFIPSCFTLIIQEQKAKFSLLFF